MSDYDPYTGEREDGEWNDRPDEDEAREEWAQRRRDADERENELSLRERGLV